MSIPEYFKKIFIFQDLTEEEGERVLQLLTPVFYYQGQVILKEGEPGDSLYLLNEGEVEVTKRLTMALDQDTPTEKLMMRLRAEDGVSFGEMALLEKEARSATVKALSDCRLLELRRQDFLTYIQENPGTGIKITLRLAQLLSRYLRKTNQDVVKLTTALAISLGG